MARGADAPELLKLNDLFNGGGCNTVETVAESLEGNGREMVYVAADGKTLAGFCCGQIQQSICYAYPFAEITELYVMDAYRRQGIGKQLLVMMENALFKRGVKHLHILTGRENHIAQALYRACGYGDTSEILLDKGKEL
ncbi:MAG: GNAT family N-acetyltransferase [Clostridia bacterium]|nr:GNAT family N-acetyltransferase [Clostridia bacterium]